MPTLQGKLMATGLKFPEGPIALTDGSVLLVEIGAGRYCTHLFAADWPRPGLRLAY